MKMLYAVRNSTANSQQPRFRFSGYGSPVFLMSLSQTGCTSLHTPSTIIFATHTNASTFTQEPNSFGMPLKTICFHEH